jgi:hypothetical protein
MIVEIIDLIDCTFDIGTHEIVDLIEQLVHLLAVH